MSFFDRWQDSLPFEPTEDHSKAFEEIGADLHKRRADAAPADGGGGLRKDRGSRWARC